MLLAMQKSEIGRHKWLESQKANQDVGRRAAAEWVAQYAADFRRWFEEEYIEESAQELQV